jgi:hypothetical protein
MAISIIIAVRTTNPTPMDSIQKFIHLSFGKMKFVSHDEVLSVIRVDSNVIDQLAYCSDILHSPDIEETTGVQFNGTKLIMNIIKSFYLN